MKIKTLRWGREILKLIDSFSQRTNPKLLQKGLFELNLEGIGQILQTRGKIGASYLMVQAYWDDRLSRS